MSLPTLNNDNDKKKDSKTSSIPKLPNFDNDLFREDDEIITEEFEELDIEDIYEDEDQDNNEIYMSVDEDESKLPTMNNLDLEHTYIDNEDDYYPDYEEDLKLGEENKDKFIDKKNKKLIPFGGKKSKKKIKSSDFDDRKNVLAKTKIIRTLVLFAIAALFIFGLKNTFLPSHVYTGEQIKELARQGAGQTGFPLERGESFVENFMDLYLTIDREDKGLLEMLNYYYGKIGADSLSNNDINMKTGRDVKQKTLIKPKVYEVNPLTPYSTQYKISTYVSDVNGDNDLRNGRWLSFVVNVYYDEKADSLAITKDSPIIIPPYRISESTIVPKRMPLGNGTVNDTIGPAINPTINGFIEAYANSSISSHESILQYIDDKNNIDLYDGFGGSVKLKDTPSNSIDRTIYDSDDGIYRVDLTVKWVDAKAIGEGKEIEYVSKYIMRIKPVEGEEGKYVVSRFLPYDYWKKE